MESVFALLTAAAVAFGPLSIGVTKLVDTLRNTFDREDKLPKVTWNIAAFAVALLVCILFELNVMEALTAAVPRLSGVDMSGITGEILTGIGVGATASYWHEKMDKGTTV